MNALLDIETLPGGVKIRVARGKGKQEPTVVPVERDGRVMNRMDPSTRLVHAMLEQWGQETRGLDIGLPSTTVLGRVIDQGPGAGQPGQPVSNMSEQSAKVDACVARLWKRSQLCVVRYYQFWEPVEVMARREKMSPSQFKETLRRARWLIGSWLEVEKKA